MKRLALLTSGGDAPGMNATIRAVVRSADAAGCSSVGVRNGYSGLILGDFVELDARSVSGILHLGGTMLGTARSKQFLTPEGRRTAADALRQADVEGLVVIGGDGSMRGAELLSREGNLAVVGLPGTIDNDLYGTDFTIGFDTAVNTALESIDRIRDTAASHGRLFFVEVMGRHSGWIALYSALAGGGTEVLVPARAEYSAIQPLWRPMTSTKNSRPWLAAVSRMRSIDSRAVLTAVSKPMVKSVPYRSLSMVPGSPTTARLPSRESSSAPRMEPSPPITTSPSTSACRRASAAVRRPSGVRNCLERAVPSIVPPRCRMPDTERASSSTKSPRISPE